MSFAQFMRSLALTASLESARQEQALLPWFDLSDSWAEVAGRITALPPSEFRCFAAFSVAALDSLTASAAAAAAAGRPPATVHQIEQLLQDFCAVAIDIRRSIEQVRSQQQSDPLVRSMAQSFGSALAGTVETLRAVARIQVDPIDEEIESRLRLRLPALPATAG